jgi:hypothetical protein
MAYLGLVAPLERRHYLAAPHVRKLADGLGNDKNYVMVTSYWHGSCHEVTTLHWVPNGTSPPIAKAGSITSWLASNRRSPAQSQPIRA